MELIDLINALVPEGTEKEINIDGNNVKISKKDGELEIEIVDNKIKECVSEFKKNIEDLDDDLFIDCLEEFGNTKELDDLLKKDSFENDEADKIKNLISDFSKIVRSNLQEEIERLIHLYEQF